MACAITLVSLGTLCSATGENAVLTLNGATAEQGKVFSVNVSVSGNPGICAMTFRVKYDKNTFVYSGVRSTAFDSVYAGSNDSSGTVIVLDRSSDYSSNGVVATIEFVAKENAGLGDFQFIIDEIHGANAGEQDVTVEAVAGVVTVTDAKDVPDATVIGSFKYDITNNEIAISEFTGDETVISVAKEYEIDGKKYPVNAIGEEAFSGMDTVTEIYIPDTVEEIGANAMDGCTALEKIVINGDPVICDEATLGCTALKTIVINGNPEIGEHALGYYKKAKTYYTVEGTEINGWRGDGSVASNAQQYAKDNGITFVPMERFSFRGYQTTDMTGAKFNIRFVSSIDGLNYTKVKFDISESNTGKNWTSDSTKVYKSLNGQTADGTVFQAVTASQFGDKYLYAFAIKNIPTNIAVNFTVNVYAQNIIGAWVKTGVATVCKDLSGNWSYDYDKISD